MKIPDKYLNKLDIVYQYYALSFMLAVEISDWLDFILKKASLINKWTKELSQLITVGEFKII